MTLPELADFLASRGLGLTSCQFALDGNAVAAFGCAPQVADEVHVTVSPVGAGEVEEPDALAGFLARKPRID